MTTDATVEGVEKGEALLHDRRIEDRAEEMGKKWEEVVINYMSKRDINQQD